jgi:PAS domain S-box-containing protein
VQQLAMQPTLPLADAARLVASVVDDATIWVRVRAGEWEGADGIPTDADARAVDDFEMASRNLPEPWDDVCFGLLLRHARGLRDHGELVGARERYAALRDISFEGIAVHRDGVILEVNQALADLYGYSRDEMIGMHMSRTVDPEVFGRVMELVRSRYEGAYETSALRKDGTTLPLEARGKDYVFDGQPVRVASFRDIRERKAAEASMRRAQKAAEEASIQKSRFLANLSHEIRTPLNAVLGVVDLLQWTELADAQRDLLATLEQSAVSMVGLMDELLDVSRIETGEMRFDEQPFSLSDVVRSAVAIARDPADGVAQDIDLAGVPDRLSGDASRIRQILVNLLENASKFTHTGTICVRATQARDSTGAVRLHLAVADTGTGIAHDVLPNLFNRFEQGTQHDAGGTGLGLYISRNLARGMGGDLTVDSALGRGSTFLLDLPLRLGSPPEAGRDEQGDLAPGRVLVVEDNPTNQRVVQELLRVLGQEATVVGDGQAGVEVALAGSFDLVLMDIRMPGMDGLEATRRLRSAGYDGRIVALTAHAMQAELQACIAAGMDDHLTKPLRLDALRAALASPGKRERR